MKLFFSKRFQKDYKKLPAKIQELTDNKLDFLLRDVNHPSLRFKKVKKHFNVWEVSVTMNYRVVLSVESDHYVLLRVGVHNILNRI